MGSEGFTLKSNTEFGFLYKKLTRIRPNVISKIALVPEYMDALKEYKGTFSDEVVYRIIMETFKKMLADGKGYYTARDVMNKVSRDVTGSSSTWQNE